MNLDEHYCPNCGAAYRGSEVACAACGSSLKVTKQLDEVKNTPITPSLRLAVHLQTLQLFNERYRIVRQVGVGGFGAVYEAADTWEPRHVAIKEIGLTSLSAQQVIEATGSFNREVQMLSSLKHAGIPRIYEHLTDSDHWYLVMEFVPGKTLERLQEQTSGRRLPFAQVLNIGIQICTVLEFLHSQRPAIIFRDLKPANIMLTPEGYLYLIDFGVARRYQRGSTRDTIAFGSPGYAAPEQYGRAQTTPLSDIYSLGALLYCLLTGDDPSEHPFQFPPLHLSGVEGMRELDALIQRMVATDPAQRPQRVHADLQRIQYIHDQSTRRTPLWIPPKGQTPPAFAALAGSRPGRIASTPSAPAATKAVGTRQQQQMVFAQPALPAAQQAQSTLQQPQPAQSTQQAQPAPPQSQPALPKRKTTRRRVLVGGFITACALVTTVSLVKAWESSQNSSVTTENIPASNTETVPTPQSSSATPATIGQNPVIPPDGVTYWSTDMSHAVVLNGATELEIYSVKTQQLLDTVSLADGTFYSTSPLITWSPDNSQFVFSDDVDDICFVWNIQQKKQIYTLPQITGTAAWSPDNQYLAAKGLSNQAGATLLLLGATNGKQLAQASFTDADALDFLAWSPDSRYLVFTNTKSNSWQAGTSWSMELWDSQARQQVGKIGGTLPASISGSFYYTASGLAWSPNGNIIAVGMDNDIWLIRLADSQAGPHQVKTSLLSGAATNSSAGFASNMLTWAPNSRYLAISQNATYGSLNVYDISSGKNILAAMNSSGGAFVALTWAADSKSLTTVDDGNIISTWKIG